MVDAVRGLLARIEPTGTEGDADHTELIATLSTLLEDAASEAEAQPPVPLPRRGRGKITEGTTRRRGTEGRRPGRGRAVPPIGEVLVQAGAATTDAVEIARMEQDLGDDRRSARSWSSTARPPRPRSRPPGGAARPPQSSSTARCGSTSSCSTP